MIIIKIRLIGSLSKKGYQLKNIIKKVIRTKDYDIELEEINNKYGMKKNTPTLIIDDQVIGTGVVFNEKEINKILNKFVLSN